MINIPYHYSAVIKWFQENHPSKMNRLWESISHNQIENKKWLVDSLDNVTIPRDENGRFKIEIIGGWFGFPLVDLLYEKYGDQIKAIDFYEPDKFCWTVFKRYSEVYFDDWRGDGYGSMDVGDMHIQMYNMNYFYATVQRRVHLVINTSCEHMPDMDQMKQYYELPERTLLALQSNDKTDEPDHINCVTSTQELAEKAGVKLLNGGWMTMTSLDAEGKKEYYNRYQVLGKWK